MIRGRFVGLFGSCGWSGGGVKALNEFVNQAGLELIQPVVEAHFSANGEQVEQCLELGRNVAKVVWSRSA